MGRFHKHDALTVHSLHKGRGTYALIRDNGDIETFRVGMVVERGEKMQWVVPGGIWKASWLADGEEEGLLITEVCLGVDIHMEGRDLL